MQWFNIGLQLGLSAADLNRIRANHELQQDRLRETLILWLKGVGHAPTWKRLADALKSRTVKEYNLGKFVEENHCDVGQDQVVRVNYSDHLRHLYRDLAPLQMLQWPKLPHYEFVTLAMIKQEYRKTDMFVERTLHGTLDDIIRQKEEISLEDIFDKTEAKRKVILIEGAPGAGKTM